ncbi:MAG: HAD family hydrolase [Candidatus Bathyarchaeota archaeon]|jgi:HAD superfamily hydrolase (TIGR01549 family)
MNIEAVILDFGGTLASGEMDWYEYHSAIRLLLTGLGYEVENARLDKAIRSSLQELRRVRSRGKEMTLEEVYGSALERQGLIPDGETLREIHGIFKQHYRSVFYPCTERVLEELHRKYKLAMISNTFSDQPRELLEERGLDELFEVMICSRDLGVRKPNPEIFRYTLDTLGMEAKQAVHVGDSVEADMEGAAGVGITPIWIRTQGEKPWSGRAISSICELPSYLERM